MFKIGDHVIFSLDGAKGVILEMNDSHCQVFWEDYFVSWEKRELLVKDESGPLTKSSSDCKTELKAE